MGNAEGQVEEELRVPCRSLCGAQQRSESSVWLFSDDVGRAPLLNTIHLCPLPFSLPDTYFFRSHRAPVVHGMTLFSRFVHPWGLTSNPAVFPSVSGLYCCGWHNGRSTFLPLLIGQFVCIASPFHSFTSFPTNTCFYKTSFPFHCKCKPSPFLFTCIFCLLRARAFSGCDCPCR